MNEQHERKHMLLEKVEQALEAWGCKLEVAENIDGYVAVLPNGFRVLSLDRFFIQEGVESVAVITAFLGLVLAQLSEMKYDLIPRSGVEDGTTPVVLKS